MEERGWGDDGEMVGGPRYLYKDELPRMLFEFHFKPWFFNVSCDLGIAWSCQMDIACPEILNSSVWICLRYILDYLI